MIRGMAWSGSKVAKDADVICFFRQKVCFLCLGDSWMPMNGLRNSVLRHGRVDSLAWRCCDAALANVSVVHRNDIPAEWL